MLKYGVLFHDGSWFHGVSPLTDDIVHLSVVLLIIFPELNEPCKPAFLSYQSATIYKPPLRQTYQKNAKPGFYGFMSGSTVSKGCAVLQSGIEFRIITVHD